MLLRLRSAITLSDIVLETFSKPLASRQIGVGTPRFVGVIRARRPLRDISNDCK